MRTKKHVLILCTGNSARSQMAEGLVNHFLGDQWHASSAGTRPSGYVHPLAIKAMSELGIDLLGHHSKSTDEFRGQSFNRIITVCDNAAEDCPVWLGSGIRIHIGFEDPAKVEGAEIDRLAAFRRIRDEIREQVLSYLAEQAENQEQEVITKK